MRRLAPLLVLLTASACGSDDDSDGAFPASKAQQAITDYKRVVQLNYQDVLAGTRALDLAVRNFVDAPFEQPFAAAKAAWLAARVPYGPSEAFRFYGGPIDDDESGPEGLINGWPLDENYIDYTRDMKAGGIVNDVANYPTLTAELIERANEARGEKALSTGYHAIEFLLWGQDDATPGTGAGKRAFTDYAWNDPTAPNAPRRREYLSIVSTLLVQHVESVAAQWDTSKPDSYGARFGVTADDEKSDARKEALSKILTSLGEMAKVELSGERMTVAYKNRSEEDEHSCFSDNTAVDLLGNGLGLQNVWLGRYGTFDGVGIDEVVAAVDPALATKTTADLQAAVSKLQALADFQKSGTPIDVIVLQKPDESPERTTMREAIEALKVFAGDIERAAAALGLSVKLEDPSEEL